MGKKKKKILEIFISRSTFRAFHCKYNFHVNQNKDSRKGEGRIWNAWYNPHPHFSFPLGSQSQAPSIPMIPTLVSPQPQAVGDIVNSPPTLSLHLLLLLSPWAKQRWALTLTIDQRVNTKHLQDCFISIRLFHHQIPLAIATFQARKLKLLTNISKVIFLEIWMEGETNEM